MYVITYIHYRISGRQKPQKSCLFQSKNTSGTLYLDVMIERILNGLTNALIDMSLNALMINLNDLWHAGLGLVYIVHSSSFAFGVDCSTYNIPTKDCFFNSAQLLRRYRGEDYKLIFMHRGIALIMKITVLDLICKIFIGFN